MPQISIIVPVYNVEKYISRCIDSILNQTFTDFELILINDGSSDQSGEICDDYVKKDIRIRVIHKENGGPAEARNVGLDVAKGKYVGFVDSDDYIDVHMYEELYTKCQQEKIDICTCGRFDVYEDGSKIRSTFERDDVETWSNKKAIENLLIWNGIDSSPCDKLFKMELFKYIRFPEDKNVEDIHIIYKLIDISNGVVHVGKAYYYYYHRMDSRSVEAFSPKRLDILEIALEIRKFIFIKYPDLNKAADCFYIKNVIFLYMLMQNKYVKDRYRDSYKQIKSSIQRNFFIILTNPYIDYKNKIICILICFELYDFYKFIKNIFVKIK